MKGDDFHNWSIYLIRSMWMLGTWTVFNEGSDRMEYVQSVSVFRYYSEIRYIFVN